MKTQEEEEQDTIDVLVRDLTQVAPRAKSEVRRRLLQFRENSFIAGMRTGKSITDPADWNCHCIKPNPGSDEARALGDICPVLDNEYGKGFGDPPEFWITEGCPLHAPKSLKDLKLVKRKKRVKS